MPSAASMEHAARWRLGQIGVGSLPYATRRRAEQAFSIVRSVTQSCYRVTPTIWHGDSRRARAQALAEGRSPGTFMSRTLSRAVHHVRSGSHITTCMSPEVTVILIVNFTHSVFLVHTSCHSNAHSTVARARGPRDERACPAAARCTRAVRLLEADSPISVAPSGATLPLRVRLRRSVALLTPFARRSLRCGTKGELRSRSGEVERKLGDVEGVRV